MKKIICILLVLLFVFTACGSNNTQKEEQKTIYAEDEVVNKFFTEYIESGHELTDIKQGNIRTKYTAYINDAVYIEIINATNNAGILKVSIHGNDNATTEPLWEVFPSIVKVLDNTLTYDEIRDCVKKMVNKEVVRTEYQFKENFKISEFQPGSINTPRIDIECTTYK